MPVLIDFYILVLLSYYSIIVWAALVVMLLCTWCPKNCAPFVWLLGAAVDLINLVLYGCIDQASNYSLSPCMSKSDMWLLICGREKAK